MEKRQLFSNSLFPPALVNGVAVVVVPLLLQRLTRTLLDTAQRSACLLVELNQPPKCALALSKRVEFGADPIDRRGS